MPFRRLGKRWPELGRRGVGSGIGGGSVAPLLSFTDDFARADGVVGNGWTGTTFAISSNKVVNTPTLGAELLTDGGLENWSSPTNLTNWTEGIAGTSTVNQETVDVHGGSNAARLDIDASSSNATFRQSVTAVNKWVLINWWMKNTGGYGFIDFGASINASSAFNPGASYVNYNAVVRSAPSGNNCRAFDYATSSQSIYFDDLSVKALTDSELVLTRPVYPTADYVLSVNVAALELGTMAGIIFALDNPSNPQNYYLVSFKGSDFSGLTLHQVKAGVLTSIIPDLNPYPATVYSANDKLTVAKSGTNIRVYKNDILVSTTKTADAALTNNLYAGIFSTHSGNQLDNWSEVVRPVGGSTAYFDAFFLP